MGRDKESQLERRDFLTASVVAFGAGLPGVLLAQSGSGQTPVAGERPDPADAIDPLAPPGLKPNGALDARFPVSYQRSVPAACRVMTEHFHAIAQRDYSALAKTLHFPFAIVEGIDTIAVQ